MTSVTTTVETRQRERQQGRQGRRSLIGMTAATLILVGGVALWQGRSTSREVAQIQGGSAVVARPAETAPGTLDQEQYSRWQVGTFTSAAATQTVYLVASEEAAAELHARFAALATTDGWYQVLVHPTTDDAILRGLGAMDEIRAAQGLPAIQVSDLRGS